MSENSESKETKPQANTAKNSGSEQKTSNVPLWSALTIILIILLLLGHVLSDKYVPYTSNGRIEAFVVPIVPQVSGTLTEINVENNQLVKEGQVLATIDASNYELAVEQAQTDLRLATQTSEADVSTVATAQAKVAEAEANLRNAEVKGQRIIKLSEQGAASVSRADDARSKIEASKARLASARSELEKAKSNLGNTGRDNAKVQAALVALDNAQLDLYRSSIRAPSDGIITNLSVDVGHFASTGAPVMTFISTRTVWVQSDMRENALVNIKPGNQVELVLDAAPGRVFAGEVMSVGFGVSDDSSNNIGGLATVQPSQGWLRQAQHIPVLIRFANDDSKEFQRVGGQVNTIIYTEGHPFLTLLGGWWIRIISVLSHLY